MIARHSALDVSLSLSSGDSDGSLQDLFELLRKLSGSVEPEVVHETVAQAIRHRFPQTSRMMVLLRDAKGEWVPDFGWSADGVTDDVMPSRTLVARAVDSRVGFISARCGAGPRERRRPRWFRCDSSSWR